MQTSKFPKLDCERRTRNGGSSAGPNAEICSLRIAVLGWAFGSVLLWSALIALWRMA